MSDALPSAGAKPVGPTTTGPLRRSDRIGRAFAVIGIVGPLFYIALVTLLGLLWDGYDPIQQTQSELGAVDAPYGEVMNVAGFMGIGVTILSFAVAYYLLLNGGLAQKLATVLLVFGGVGMVVVGFFPCDAQCIDVTRTGELHSTFSMPGAFGLPAAAMVSSLAFRDDGRFGVLWQAASFWLGLLILASGPVIALELVPAVDGALQRTGMWASLLWVAAVSSKLRSLPRHPNPRSIGQPGPGEGRARRPEPAP